MQLYTIDWLILASFFAFTLAVGLWSSRRASESHEDYFLSGRDKSWWLLGTSMVATTFAADTPLFVAGLIRTDGVSGNWIWWAFLLTGMLTVAVYAKLWRRSQVFTDNEFYELRYSGKPAAALRGFRAVYLGLVYNVIVMATVTVAAIKIGMAMFGFSPIQTILVATLVTVVFSALGGLTSVLIVDFVLFIIAMAGAIGAAVVLLGLPEVGGLTGLFENPAVQSKMAMFPSLDLSTTEGLNSAMTVLIIPLAIQWWAAWYPGAEPGGGGYVAQRMLAAKNESHAAGATLLFNVAHYALRPWPWILVGFISMVVYPSLDSLKTEFAGLPENMLRDDLAYPAMMKRLPAGLLGLVTASLAAAYMSTIATHLNWGSSYLVHDLWKRFIQPQASQRQLVAVGRVATVLLMVLAALMALRMSSVLEGFQILLQVGAGTGLIYILRWFWWRINALAEIVAMVVSFSIALGFWMLVHEEKVVAPPSLQWLYGTEIAWWQQFLTIVALTTACWMLAVFFGPTESQETMRSFLAKIRPGGPGWRRVIQQAHADRQLLELDTSWNLPSQIVFAIAGCGAIYGILFGTGFMLYGQYMAGTMALALAIASSILLRFTWHSVADDN